MKILTYLFNLFLPLIGGLIISIIISPHIDYNTLILPSLAPPKNLFPTIWSLLYLFMGCSYLLLNVCNQLTIIEKKIYYLQLFINYMWSIIFFLWKLRLLAIFWIVFLDFIVLYMLIRFYQKNKLATYLNIPYLLWIIFATYLTISIYFLNL